MDPTPPAIIVRVNRNQEYVVQATVGGAPFDLVLDTGFTDERGGVCVSLDGHAYRSVRGRLSELQDIRVQSIGGRVDFFECGVSEVALQGLTVLVARAQIVKAGANLLGVCFFHHLPGYGLDWDFSARTMTIARRPDSGS